MRREFFIFILVFLLVGAALYAVGAWRAPITPEGVIFERLTARAGGIRTLGLGPSHAWAFDFPVLDERGFSLWSTGADIFELAHLLRLARPELEGLENLVVALPFFAFAQNNGRAEKALAKRRAIYAINHGWRSFLLIDHDPGNLVLGKLGPLVTPHHWREVWRPKPGEEARRRANVNRYGMRSQETEGFDAEVNAAQLHLKSYLEIPAEEKDRAQAALARLVRSNRAAGRRVVLVTTPFTRGYNQKVERGGREFLRDFYARVHALRRAEGCEYLDFSHDPDFMDHTRYFLNADHLNPQGAALFSAKLKKAAGLPYRPGPGAHSSRSRPAALAW